MCSHTSTFLFSLFSLSLRLPSCTCARENFLFFSSKKLLKTKRQRETDRERHLFLVQRRRRTRFCVCMLQLRALATSFLRRERAPSTFSRSLRVLAFGHGASGALGQGDLVDSAEPLLVENLPENVTTIGCGHFHSLAVTSDGECKSNSKRKHEHVSSSGHILSSSNYFFPIPPSF